MSHETSDARAARERELFLGALEQKAEERLAFLALACGQDHVLRQNVEALLRVHEGAGDFLETPVAGISDSTQLERALWSERSIAGPDTAGLLGEWVDRYKLLRQLGEGGCGVVYMAEQQAPVQRRVALKVIKLGMDTKSVIARFEAESQALALMDHPHIAKVLDAGATSTGRPFFVMELVHGTRITEYCDQANLATPARLNLFLQVCQAIQHAHQKGIIHRDIKPSNILITLQDGVPVPKVIDFGVAKAIEHRLTGKTLFTEVHALVGTPAYMSPEQAELKGLDVDTRSDIYSLGVLLYELLTGETPFDPEQLSRLGLDEVRRLIREVEPPRPSSRLKSRTKAAIGDGISPRLESPAARAETIRGDLDWIVMKCLEKDPGRRYATVNGLIADLQRFLANEPVLARPPSDFYRFQKWATRHRGAMIATTAVAVTLVAATITSVWLMLRATQAEKNALASQRREIILRKRAEAERERATGNERLAQLNEYVAEISGAQQSLQEGNYNRALQLVKKQEPRVGEPDLRGFEWRYLRALCDGDERVALTTQASTVLSVAFSPSGDLMAAGTRDSVQVWDSLSRSPVTRLRASGESIAFAAQGKVLIAGGIEEVRLWRTSDWSEERSLPDAFGPVVVSWDGKRLASRTRGAVCVWNTADWSVIRLLPRAFGPMAFSPDGTVLATERREGVVLWALDGKKPEILLHDSGGLFMRPSRDSGQGLVFSPDGEQVIAGHNSLTTRGVYNLGIWDAATGQEVGTIPDNPEHVEHTGMISSVGITADGRFLVSASWDHSVRLWDYVSKRHLATLHGHLAEVWTLAVSPDGHSVLTGAKDGGVNLWPLQLPEARDQLAGDWEPIAVSKDGKRLAALGGPKHGLVLLNLATREIEQEFALPQRRGRPPLPPTISADLRILAQAEPGARIKIRNTSNDQTVTLKAEGGVDFLTVSPDGTSLIWGGRDLPLHWLHLPEGTNLVKGIFGERALFSADGRTLAVSGSGNRIQIWDVAGHCVRTNFTVTPRIGRIAALSADGRLLALTESLEDPSNTIGLYDTGTGRLLGTCVGHLQGVWGVAFSPDGKTLASTSSDCTMKLWNVATQQEMISVSRLGSMPSGLLFSPGGQLLIWSFGRISGPVGMRFFRAPLAGWSEATESQAGLIKAEY